MASQPGPETTRRQGGHAPAQGTRRKSRTADAGQPPSCVRPDPLGAASGVKPPGEIPAAGVGSLPGGAGVSGDRGLHKWAIDEEPLGTCLTPD